MDISDLGNLKGIVQINSIEYLDEVFKSLMQKTVVVPLKNNGFKNQIKHLVIEDIVTPKKKAGWYSPKFLLNNDDDIAQISFTSGTEGEPKGIILTHKNLHNSVERLIDVMGISDEIREYVGVPVYHSFGYGRVRVCNQVGGKVFIPEAGFNPQEIAELLSNHEINAISAVPTLWRILLQQKHLFVDIGKYLRWIEIGSQFMSEEEKDALCILFPNARIVQHYGLTEASRSTFLIVSDRNNLNTVGQPSKGSQIRLNETGQIEIKGDHVAKFQISSTGLKKIVDESDWFTTSDLGKIEHNYLTFLGRSDDIINIGGLKVSPEFLERQMSKRIEIDIVIAKIDDPIRGETLLISILDEHVSQINKIHTVLHDVLSEMNITLGGQAPIQIVEEFPVTDTGKIQRSKLSKEYYKQSNDNAPINSDASLAEKFAYSLKLPSISDKDSFLSLNGDSLLFMMMTIEVEKHIGYIPENWEAMTFGHLETLATKKYVPDDPKKFSYSWLLILVIISLIVGEAFLQIRSHIKTGRSAFNLINDESTVVYNKELGVKTYRPNIKINDYKTGVLKYEINALGLRSPTIDVYPKKGELRIAVVGASTVAGAYAETNGNTFPALLESNLRRDGTSAKVINGGIEGLTLNGITTITKEIILPLNPKYVVIYTGFNDITSICRSPQNNSSPKLQPLFKVPQMANWLMTADMIKKNTVELREAPKSNKAYLNADSIDVLWYQEKISKIVSLIKSQGSIPILMTNARSYVNVDSHKVKELVKTSLYYYYCLDTEGIIKVGEKLNNGIRQIATANALPLIDLAKIMPGGIEYFVDGGHFTLKGEKYVAQELTDFFNDIQVID